MEDDVNIEDVLSFYNMVTITRRRTMRKMVKDDDEDGDEDDAKDNGDGDGKDEDDHDGDDEDGDEDGDGKDDDDHDGKDESALPGEGALLTVHRHRNLRKQI